LKGFAATIESQGIEINGFLEFFANARKSDFFNVIGKIAKIRTQKVAFFANSFSRKKTFEKVGRQLE